MGCFTNINIWFVWKIVFEKIRKVGHCRYAENASTTEIINSKGLIKEIEAEGKDFDPNFHEAVMHVEDENAGENTVVEVFMKGYAKGDRVLREALVKVAN